MIISVNGNGTNDVVMAHNNDKLSSVVTIDLNNPEYNSMSSYYYRYIGFGRIK
jgi:hypothetical protein